MKKDSKSTFDVKKAEDSSGFLLWQVTNLWQRKIKASLSGVGLTHTQFVLLASILWFSETRESFNQARLSAHTKIDPMTTSTVLRTLQRKGFLKRKEHHIDTRSNIIELSDSGKETAKQAVRIIEKCDNTFFEKLGGKKDDFNKKLSSLLN